MPCSAAAFHWPLRRGALRLFGLLLALLAFLAPTPSARAISIQIDYSYDTLGFFGTAQNPTPARTTLEFAARAFTPFTDTLSAIQPSGGNSWTARFIDPSTNTYKTVLNLTVPQDTLVVYAIARDLAVGVLGQASPGDYLFNGAPSTNFANAVSNRGQGDSNFDFAPWGGVIAVDVQKSLNVPRVWHYDLGSAPSPGSYDFYTVATHELAHIFGFGTSSAFTNDILRMYNPPTENTAFFTGAISQQLYGGTVPMHVPSNATDKYVVQHWDSSVTSPPFLPGTQPKPSLGPSVPLGERKLLTPLDYAALADIGWQVPPELLGLPADFNGDVIVDGADFLIWQRGYGGFGGTPGDANGDLFVDDFDGWIVRNYLGSQGVVPEGLAAVPEPTAAALALVAGALTCVSRLRYRRRGFAQ
jgi:hypothetical protein